MSEMIKRLGPGALVALAATLLGSPAAAQHAEIDPVEAARCEDVEPWVTMTETDNNLVRNYCLPKQSPFQLRGTGDFAGSGMRSAAPDVEYWVTNTGYSDSGKELQGRTLPFYIIGTENRPTTWGPQNFELQFFAAAARGDWLRNRDIAESLHNVKGGGWTYLMNTQRLGGFHQWAGHDGSLGELHSGAQHEAEGCLDHGGLYRHYPRGFPLLGGSDCPQTWGSSGWQGRRPIGTVENWVDYYQASVPDEFNFDFWRVPDEFKTEDKEFVGDFQVYGMMSDHGSDYLDAYYGNVVPGGSGDPTLEGYPLGLDVAFNAYSFKVPSVSRGFVYEGMIINNSEEVYGVPLDYDSLFFGMLIRPLRNIGGNGRSANGHAIPEMGAIVHNEIGRTPDCDGARDVPGSSSCSTFRNRSTRGFRAGAQGHIFLKTPIGDLRNKHFSDPSSPFYNPTHPNVNDTITVNRYSLCDFRCAIQQFIFDARKGYGILAHSPRDALDGRDPADLSEFERWGIFKGQYYDPTTGAEQFCDVNNPTAPGCFGYMVPGDWSYSNKPPGSPIGPDTLWYPKCQVPTSSHPAANTCVEVWSDTFPDKTIGWTQNVIWPTVGPFPLKAGDTAAFVVATFASPDSAQFMTDLKAFHDFYVQDFFLGPGLPSPPNITNVAVRGGSYNLGEPLVTLFLDDAAENWVDPFALKMLEELENAQEGTIFGNIVEANPDAVEQVRALIFRNNVDSLYIFKSCDNGRTLTSQAAARCEPSPAEDETGSAIGTGWQAYRVFTPTNGRFPKTVTDGAVPPGRRYLYSAMVHTPGIHFETPYVSIDEDGIEEIRDTVLTIVPEGRSLFNLNAANPYVADVYVPATRQAGAADPSVSVLAKSGSIVFPGEQAEVVFQQGAAQSGSFRLTFGGGVVVMEYSTAGVVDSTVVRLQKSIQARLPDETLDEVFYGEAVYRSMDEAGVSLGFPEGVAATTTTVDGSTVRTWTVEEPAGVLVDLATDEPLFVSSTLESGQFTPGSFQLHPRFPQFVIDLDNDPGDLMAYRWLRGERNLRLAYSEPSVEWLNSQSEATGFQFGTYRFRWEGPAFAFDLPSVNLFEPARTEQAYQRMLNERAVAQTTATGADVLAAIQRDIDSSVTADDLLSVKLPFTVRNMAFGTVETGTTVRVAMLANAKRETALLGRAPDSVTVSVPDDVWIPGEPLIFLEEVEIARTDEEGNVVLSGGEPVTETELRVTWSTAMLACSEPRPTCNPVSGPGGAGSPGHVTIRPVGHDPQAPDGWQLEVAYQTALTSQTLVDFEVTPTRVGTDIERVTRADLDRVNVVPNPYIGRSAFEYNLQEGRRVMFTNLPPTGTIQIFTVAGQFVQQLQWNADDLAGNGDLYYDLTTREGNHIASGLYLFVLQTEDPASGSELKRTGRFIIIK